MVILQGRSGIAHCIDEPDGQPIIDDNLAPTGIRAYNSVEIPSAVNEQVDPSVKR